MKTDISIQKNIPGVIYSHLEHSTKIGEQFIPQHGLCYIVNGTIKVVDGDTTKTFGSGEIILYRKNFLAKFLKIPSEGEKFLSITVMFDTQSLEEFSRNFNAVYQDHYDATDAVVTLKRTILLSNYFATLMPYFNSSLPEELVNLKRQEALMLILQAQPELVNLLFNFAQPGKIDLEEFMQRNFRFNVSLEKLAFLTGRSLASFKRDFKTAFNTSPVRWLQNKRLQEAFYLINEKKMKPSAFYHEIGFESLSHFSTSFKRKYGVNPSTIK